MALEPTDPLPERVAKATLSAYNKSQLSSLLRFRGGLVLENEVNADAPFAKIVDDLVVLLEQNGDLDRFIVLALGGRPGNSNLQALASQRGLQADLPASSAVSPAHGTIADFVAAARTLNPDNADLAAIADRVGAGLAAPSASLEALVARRSKLIDFGRFQRRLDELELRVCQVRTPASLGTGFLVGPDLMLTNFHVVEGLANGTYGTADVVCEFDFNSDAPEPKRVSLSAPIRSYAPYSPSDISGTGEPTGAELDYALLSLAERIGDDLRGFFPLDPVPRLLALGDFLFVAQHPLGQGLQLALGTITDFPGRALRIRYDVTTDHGSSGGPALNAGLEVVGLHHAADPGTAPKYNQAVPLWLIARHAIDAGAYP